MAGSEFTDSGTGEADHGIACTGSVRTVHSGIGLRKLPHSDPDDRIGMTFGTHTVTRQSRPVGRCTYI